MISNKSNLQELNRLSIQDMLYKYNKRKDNNTFTDSFLLNETVYVSENQLPELVLRTKKPIDHNMAFISSNRFVDYEQFMQPPSNLYPKTPFIVSNDELILKSIRDGFELLCGKEKKSRDSNSSHNLELEKSDSFNYYNNRFTFTNIDMELELNFDMINENKKWFVKFIDPLTKEIINDIYGPMGSAELYLFLSTKSKSILKKLECFVIDCENEVYLKSDFCYLAVCEEIKEIIRENEKSNYFYRHAIENHYDHYVTQLTRRKLFRGHKSKYDLPRII